MSEPQQTSVRAAGHRRVAQAVGLILCLAGIWLLLSGHFEPLLLLLGLVSLVISASIARRMDVIDHEGVPLHLSVWTPWYWLWLAREIVTSNVDVAKRVIDPRLPIRPRLFETRASQQTDLGQVIYANSITLTPGTVSVDLDPGIIQVHALTEESAAGVEAGEMDRRVAALEND